MEEEPVEGEEKKEEEEDNDGFNKNKMLICLQHLAFLP